MGRWFISTLCTSIAAGGLTILAAGTDPIAARAIVDELTVWSRQAYTDLQAYTDFTANPAATPDLSHFITVPIQRGSLEQTVTATGALQPVDTIEVGSQLPGQIAQLYVDFNDRVRKGDPLAQIDQRSFIAKVDQARASLDVAVTSVLVQQAKLDRAYIDLDNARGNRSVLSARLENAQILEAAAKRNVDRKTVLRSHEVATATAVEEAQTDLASRKALSRETVSLMDLNTFAVNAASAEVRRLEAELAQAKASLPLHQATLRAAEIELDRTTIRSPIDGVVVGRFVNEGQTLATGLEARTAFNIAKNLTEMEIHARVDETDIGRIVGGQHASFTVDAYPGRHFEAVVRQVRKASQINQGVVTYTVVLKTDNREGLLLPGMTALARLTIHRDENVLKVPLAALRFKPAKSAAPSPRDQAVWIQDAGGGLRAVPVKTGASSIDQVALRDGALSEGDRVVVGQADAAEPTRFFGIKFGL